MSPISIALAAWFVYSQIGLVMLIGLAAKNTILTVEFAKDVVEKGKPLAEAAMEGARLRLRPILMTSFAFTLGCVPLGIASGAGAEDDNIRCPAGYTGNISRISANRGGPWWR